MRGFVDINRLQIGKVDRNGPVISCRHDLQSFDNMFEPAIDFPVFVRRDRQGKRRQTILYDFARPLQFVHSSHSSSAKAWRLRNVFGAKTSPGDTNSPKNRDFYANLKAQAWWELRRRFERTYRAVNDPEFTWNVDELISIPSSIPLLRKIEKELSQPTAGQGARLKMVVDKKPDGARSPNLADAIVMAFCYRSCAV
jgi:hypothetical protein